MALIHLCYVSSLSDIFLEREIPKIIESSVRRNSGNGITGMLLYCEGNFIQVLEGEEKVVLETFDRICDDERHQDVYEIFRGPIERRDFSQWSMGYKRLAYNELQGFPGAAPFLRLQPRDKAVGSNSEDVLSLLRAFSDNCRSTKPTARLNK